MQAKIGQRRDGFSHITQTKEMNKLNKSMKSFVKVFLQKKKEKEVITQ